jgi:hypothetical protein
MSFQRRGKLTERQRRSLWQQTTARCAPDPDYPPESPSIAEWLGEEPLPPKADRIRRTADDKPVRPTEYQEQGAVIDWWWKAHAAYGLPVFALFSVPNGAYLASGYAGAAMLKKTGMRKGTPDLILDCARGGYHGLRIEMKRVGATESDKTDEQKSFGEYLTSAGYRFQFANGASAAIAAIQQYLALRP